MAKAAKQQQPRRSSGRKSPRRAPTARPISTAGIDAIGESEPGAPDALDLAEPDLAETARPMSPDMAKSADLAAGDLDASFHGLDSGEETPGGSDPLPDQDDVDLIGHAVGLEEKDELPLANDERMAARDENRWELDPASSEDFSERRASMQPARRRRPRPS